MFPLLPLLPHIHACVCAQCLSPSRPAITIDALEREPRCCLFPLNHQRRLTPQAESSRAWNLMRTADDAAKSSWCPCAKLRRIKSARTPNRARDPKLRLIRVRKGCTPTSFHRTTRRGFNSPQPSPGLAIPLPTPYLYRSNKYSIGRHSSFFEKICITAS
jgi:hypothetical protein